MFHPAISILFSRVFSCLPPGSWFPVFLCLWFPGIQNAPAQELTPIQLGDHRELIFATTQGWGEPGWNVAAHAAGIAGESLRIGTHSFSKGIGLHATGSMTVLLDGAFSYFDAEAGLQPCAAMGSVIFRVVVDGVTCFVSPVLHSGDEPLAVHVGVAGGMELRLEIEDAGDGITCDMANLGNARLTPATPHPEVGEEKPVDIGLFGRVATWDPNRCDGARADRIQEFLADDLFLDRDLSVDGSGLYLVPVSTNHLACVGTQWLGRRAPREARLVFPDHSRIPAINDVRVEGWFGESAWQGAFKPINGKLQQVAGTLIFQIASGSGATEPVLTRKLRWIFPATGGSVAVERPQIRTRSRWAVTNLVARFVGAGGQSGAEVGIVNGELLPRDGREQAKWDLGVPLPLPIRYSRWSLLGSDPTLIQFRMQLGTFSVAVDDVLRHGAVYLPDQGVLVTTDPASTGLDEVRRRVSASKTILEEVRGMPDQTLAQAMSKTHHDAQSEGPVMLSLSCDNAKFVLERQGSVKFHDVVDTGTDWFKDAGELQVSFGAGHSKFVSRRLDEEWLPSIETTFAESGIAYVERAFVAPWDSSGTAPARLNRASACVVEFSITNRGSAALEARLELEFLRNSREGIHAGLLEIAEGWAVTGERGLIALVKAPSGGKADSSQGGALKLKREGGRLLLSGTLRPNEESHCVVLLRSGNEDLLKSRPLEELRKEFKSYWNSVLSRGMQIDTPDTLLNDVIKSSQVRCLIAARNEADGLRVAPWIAAMSYGPLESEAHSVIRGMSFLGHEEFARRGLDFFIHRYNTNGFLTTGYTTFGTAWHLWTAGEYHQIYQDRAWILDAAPKMGRVGEWIVRQLDKTAPSVAGDRPESGLMPPGVIADWNAFAYHFANNGYYYAGLRELAGMLKSVGDPRHAEFAARAEQLRRSTLRSYQWTQARSPVIQLRNGTWTPHYPSQVHSPGPLGGFFPGQDAGRSWCYDVEIGAHQLVPTGVMEPQSHEVGLMLDHMEDVQFLADGWFDYQEAGNRADWFNRGGFSKVQPYYTRNAEIYALRDDVKPFIRSYFNSLAAMLNPEVLSLWEHFNHSGAWDKTHETGYFLHQTREMFVQERAGELWIAPLLTSNWMAEGMSVRVANAPSRFGTVSYRVSSHLAQSRIEAVIEPPSRSRPEAIVLRLRHPDGRKWRAVTVNGRAHKDFDMSAQTIRIPTTMAGSITVNAIY